MSKPDARLPERNHQFDLMRILFATCVLLSHAPEITYGNPSRELLYRLTRSGATFGAFGVWGFFLLSGFLIVQSWQRNPDLSSFVQKRILRIVPGYLVAALLSTAVVGLLAPGIGHWFHHLDSHYVKSIVALSSPSTPPVLPGQAYPLVNGSLWTIPYEFRCYLLVALCGLCGFYRRPILWIVLTLLLATSLFLPGPVSHLHWAKALWPIIGDPAQVFVLTAIFCIGASYDLFRRHIVFRPAFCALAVAVPVLVDFVYPAEFAPALILCGSYPLFYLGHAPIRSLRWMRHLPDISYGIYLYGWPVESLWIWFHHGSPWTTFLVSTLICFGLGWLSWHFVERPMLTLKRRPTALLPPA